MATKTKSVDIIASGYEWICPKCDKLNLEIEITETVTCRVTWKEGANGRKIESAITELHTAELLTNPKKAYAMFSKLPQGCGATFEVDAAEHAHG
jgi:hypothetical protein